MADAGARSVRHRTCRCGDAQGHRPWRRSWAWRVRTPMRARVEGQGRLGIVRRLACRQECRIRGAGQAGCRAHVRRARPMDQGGQPVVQVGVSGANGVAALRRVLGGRGGVGRRPRLARRCGAAASVAAGDAAAQPSVRRPRRPAPRPLGALAFARRGRRASIGRRLGGLGGRGQQAGKAPLSAGRIAGVGRRGPAALAAGRDATVGVSCMAGISFGRDADTVGLRSGCCRWRCGPRPRGWRTRRAASARGVPAERLIRPGGARSACCTEATRSSARSSSRRCAPPRRRSGPIIRPWWSTAWSGGWRSPGSTAALDAAPRREAGAVQRCS